MTDSKIETMKSSQPSTPDIGRLWSVEGLFGPSEKRPQCDQVAPGEDCSSASRRQTSGDGTRLGRSCDAADPELDASPNPVRNVAPCDDVADRQSSTRPEHAERL